MAQQLHYIKKQNTNTMTHNQSPLWRVFRELMSKVGTEKQIWEMYKQLKVHDIELIIHNIQSWKETERIKGATQEKQHGNLA